MPNSGESCGNSSGARVEDKVVRLPGKAACRYSDLLSIEHDLVFARDCCTRLRQLALDGETDDTGNVRLEEALWTAASIAYARAFAGGLRLGLDESVFDEAPEGMLEMHKYVKDMRDKRIAHSVNPFEQVQTVAILNGDGSGVIGVGAIHMRLVSLMTDGFSSMNQLVNWVGHKVESKIKQALADAQEEADELSLEEVYALPENGFVVPGPDAAGRSR
jgi:hypothetical protein